MLKNTRIKICGMTNVADALLAVELGVDAIGLIFWAPSTRYISIQKAQEIVSALPPFVTTVGVVVDAEPKQLKNILANVPLDLIQFHGKETPEECDSYHKPYIKTVHMKNDVNLIEYATRYHNAKGLLLDTYQENLPGGTGEKFDWHKIPKNLSLPIILAGGLTTENVTVAIEQVAPYGVDVLTSVEASKGIKDPKKMAAFIRAVKNN